ncbi:zinc-dependent alcohol dehydrogenase family protein [Mucilaginibacter gotjawali]|uniref:Propanol-preferring alcohol dehydrogenase n=2 Tax=Mucilaginibacter gotjawali TaxID=1550579 RepID=A0A839SE35_9SPHI|nr:zinc-dependent alcohol dehydrogenase family protein [Mucilaginibacter gotjawali]MBB3056535.1 propanol-preferring alcohol dehydrogenase [Mucilaginibacter gotjawali]BAU52764.1 Alcohol dehydrogenase [Mucilaginibacter gotjawali]
MEKLPEKMRAMVFEKPGEPLHLKEVAIPKPGPNQVLVKVIACGVCRTDLHILDGELNKPKLPLIPGHEIVGSVIKTGDQVSGINAGDLVGVPWVGYTCGHCKYCKAGKENLCENGEFTGYTVNGGYAEYTVADYRYCFHLPLAHSGPEAAPLLCAGLIGYRSYRMADPSAVNIGMYGFGAAAHILIQVANQQGKKVFAFTRPGDTVSQQFAHSLGAFWAGDTSQTPPEQLDAAILFAPAGDLVPKALQVSDKGASIICGGIHMSDIPSFSYDLLWGERIIRSVANLTRNDGRDFFELLKNINVKTETEFFKLEDANQALDKLRKGDINGAAVLIP